MNELRWFVGWCLASAAVAIAVGKAFALCDDLDRLSPTLRHNLDAGDYERLFADIVHHY